MANAINTAAIMPITVGDQNPPEDEVVIGGKVTNPFPEPDPPEPPDDEPPEDEDPVFGVGDADDARPPITVKVVPAFLPEPSVAETGEAPEGQSLLTVTARVKPPFESVALQYPNNWLLAITMLTGCPGLKPVPVTVTVEPGGSAVGLRVIFGFPCAVAIGAANTSKAKMPTNRITVISLIGFFFKPANDFSKYLSPAT